MKTLVLLLSSAVFMASGYFLITDFNQGNDLNHLVYLSMLVVLMLICLLGMGLNIQLLIAEKKRVKKYIAGLSEKRLFPMEMASNLN
jgi:hypothetical protein